MEQLNTFLKIGVVEVTFTKKDGSVRVMNCTLRPDVVGQMFSRTSHPSQQVEKEGLFKVVDVDVSEFRSFNFDQVTSYTFAGLTYNLAPVAENA
jgi:hypothetical protein